MHYLTAANDLRIRKALLRSLISSPLCLGTHSCLITSVLHALSYSLHRSAQPGQILRCGICSQFGFFGYI